MLRLVFSVFTGHKRFSRMQWEQSDEEFFSAKEKKCGVTVFIIHIYKFKISLEN